METTTKLRPPIAGSYHSFYQGYIDRVSGRELRQLSEQQEDFIRSVYTGLKPGNATKGYREGKWSLNQLLGHILDTEKIMHFRALCISRGEQAAFPGFDQDAYVRMANFDDLSPQQLLRAFLLHRQLLWEFIGQVPAGQWSCQGTVSGHPMSLAALIHIIFGHLEHHIDGIRKHYGGFLPGGIAL